MMISRVLARGASINYFCRSAASRNFIREKMPVLVWGNAPAEEDKGGAKQDYLNYFLRNLSKTKMLADFNSFLLNRPSDVKKIKNKIISGCWFGEIIYL